MKKLTYEVKTEVFMNGEIHQSVTSERSNLIGDISRQVINAKDAQVKESLIKLGWTPPNESVKSPSYEELKQQNAELLASVIAARGYVSSESYMYEKLSAVIDKATS